jgi:ATP-binding cassette, subfamily A (ABC1), member 3
MNRVTSSFSAKQASRVQKVNKEGDVPAACPQNYNGVSECFAAVVFDDVPANASLTEPVHYTIQADASLGYVDVVNHKGDYEKRILPLQWAVDQAIIDLKTGVSLPTPCQWPYTTLENDDLVADSRISTSAEYFAPFKTLKLALRLCWICPFLHCDILVRIIVSKHELKLKDVFSFMMFVGISYHLPGAVAQERASGLTSHMKAMGLWDSTRIMPVIHTFQPTDLLTFTVDLGTSVSQ